MSPHDFMNRRQVIAAAAVAGAVCIGGKALLADEQASTVQHDDDYKIANGRIKQSICKWCFDGLTLDELAAGAVKMGYQSIELCPPADWPTLKKHGLICAISNSHGFVKGLAHTEDHYECLAKLRESIDATSAAGFPNVITFSGMRRGITDEDGKENMIAGVKKIIGHAEKKNVTLCLEMLNSRVPIAMKGHPDYMCDKIEWAVDICRRVGSERMKILFDIYHVQIMQGDIIARINKYHEFIGHYHTAGVPGRNEIDQSQEISYPAIMKAIVATGYKGYVGQEFIPTRPEKLATLAQAARICDV